MEAHIYLKEGDNKRILCAVHLEVVPAGTYTIDGVQYRLVDKPEFVIKNEQRSGFHTLEYVNLLVEPIP